MATSMGGGPPGTPPPMRARASAAPGFDFAHWARTRGGFVALALILLLSGIFVYVLWTLRDLPDPGQQEAVLATALEQRYSKDEILNMYLNRVYYGHNAYGLGAATKTYFGRDKEPKDLTIGQAAFLAGLINAPNYYDPQTHFERAQARQAYVLQGMVARGDISKTQADQAAQENIQSELRFDRSPRTSRAPHFVDYVMSKLEHQYGAAAVQQGGFA